MSKIFDNNYQIIYQHKGEAAGVALNMLYFGIHYFRSSSLYQNKDVIKVLCEDFSAKIPPKNELVSELILNSLVDSIKIIVAFENFMKARLLLQGYLIHSIVRDKDLNLSKEQSHRPVKVDELIASNPFCLIKQNIIGKTSAALSTSTVTMSQLLRYNKLHDFGIPEKVLSELTRHNNNRNTLHFLTSQNYSLSRSNYESLTSIINYINDYSIPQFNALNKGLKSGYDMHPLTVS